MSEQKKKDLWPTNLTEAVVVSPVAALKEQASLLAEKTKDHLQGDVVSLETESKEQRAYGFGIRAPGLKAYFFPLIKVSYNINSLFPLAVESRQIKGDDGIAPYKIWEVKSSEDYEKVIEEVLTHKTTINAVRSLLAESHAVGYDPEMDKVPF